MANFGSGSTFEYGKSLYDPYKNLRRPRAALASLLGTQRTGETSKTGALTFPKIFGSASSASTPTAFESAVQNVQDPLSLYTLASQLVVGRRKYQLASGGYGATTGTAKTLGGGQYVSNALKNILGLNFDYKTNTYK